MIYCLKLWGKREIFSSCELPFNSLWFYFLFLQVSRMEYYFQVQWGISILWLFSFSGEKITIFGSAWTKLVGWLSFFFLPWLRISQVQCLTYWLRSHRAAEVSIHTPQLHITRAPGSQTEPFRDTGGKKNPFNSTCTLSNSMTEMDKNPNRHWVEW